MKKLFLISALLLLFFAGRSQNPHVFNLPSPPNNNPLLVRSSPPSREHPASAFIFEYGDGYFTTEVNSSHAYRSGGPKPTVLSLSGRYDTIKPPRSLANSVTVTAPGKGVVFEPQRLLGTEEYIRITPIATDINEGEEMTFVITYRLPPPASPGTVHFFYNQTSFDIMEPLEAGFVMPLPFASPTSIPRIRTYFGETLIPSYTPTPGMQVNGVQTSDYQDMLAWNVNTNGEPDERNIFLTLKVHDSVPQDAGGLFQAALTVNGTTRVANLRIQASADPHDPNYLVTVPRCIEKSNLPRAVEYHLHFQNEGAGNAHNLDIEMVMDEKLRGVLPQLTDASFDITVGRKPVPGSVFSIDGNKLVFKIDLIQMHKSSSLSLNSNSVENWFVNPLTMGDIYFTLNVPANEEADMVSHASIVFYDENKNSMPAVLTQPDTLFIRDHCNKNLSPIKPLNQKPPPCKDCCATILFICWWWWVIFITALTVIIVLWLLLRRKKESDKSRAAP